MGKVARIALTGGVVLGLLLAAGVLYMQKTHQFERDLSAFAEQVDAGQVAKGNKPLGVGAGITLYTPGQVAKFNESEGVHCEQVAIIEGVYQTKQEFSGMVDADTVNIMNPDTPKEKKSEARQVISAAAKEARYALTHAHEMALKELAKHNLPPSIHQVDKAALGHQYLKGGIHPDNVKVLVKGLQNEGEKYSVCFNNGQTRVLDQNVSHASWRDFTAP